MALTTKKMIMLYDGDCGFCAKWIERWRRASAETVEYLPYQSVLPNFPQLTKEQCQEAVQLILPDGRLLSGAHAVLHALGAGGHCRVAHWLYDHVPPFAWGSECAYQWVAHHRLMLSRGHSRTCQMD